MRFIFIYFYLAFVYSQEKYINNLGKLNINYENIYEFSKMAHNVYFGINSSKWYDVSLQNVKDISIKNNTDKAYLFTNDDNSVNVISLKGTSVYLISSENDNIDVNNEYIDNIYLKNQINDIEEDFSSSAGDKYNDNLYFSCCFYKENSVFNNLECNCEQSKYGGGDYVCCKSCYEESLKLEMNYINEIKEIIENIKTTFDFEKSLVIFVGHSLGGVLASLLSIMYNKISVSFESPGDYHYIKLSNLHNKYNIDYSNIYHFGHNGDPIFMGNCGRTCSTIGYNINTKCHIGNTCLYDAKKKLGYSESILNHRIDYIIKNVIPKWKDDMPDCISNTDCSDCEKWSYI